MAYLDTPQTRYLISDDNKPCIQCGLKTPLIEIYSEARFCGDRCTSEFWTEANKKIKESDKEDEEDEEDEEEFLEKLESSEVNEKLDKIIEGLENLIENIKD